jgi:GNAT superfamily N-acetyltransferase
MRTFPIRRATVVDLGAVTALIEEAADWLRTKGTDQWSQPWPSPQGRKARLLDGLESGKTWIVWDDGAPIATITTDETANPKLWTEWEDAEPAAYLHRLVVSRSYAGFRLGAALLNWAGSRAEQIYGARWARIDVWTTNKALHRYYEREGFTFVRYNNDPEYPSGALFQRAIIAAPDTSTVELVTE